MTAADRLALQKTRKLTSFSHDYQPVLCITVTARRSCSSLGANFTLQVGRALAECLWALWENIVNCSLSLKYLKTSTGGVNSYKERSSTHGGTEATTHIFHDKGPESVMWVWTSLKSLDVALYLRQKLFTSPLLVGSWHISDSTRKWRKYGTEQCFMTSGVVSFSSSASEKKKFEEKSLVSGWSPFDTLESESLSRRSNTSRASSSEASWFKLSTAMICSCNTNRLQTHCCSCSILTVLSSTTSYFKKTLPG